MKDNLKTSLLILRFNNSPFPKARPLKRYPYRRILSRRPLSSVSYTIQKYCALKAIELSSHNAQIRASHPRDCNYAAPPCCRKDSNKYFAAILREAEANLVASLIRHYDVLLLVLQMETERHARMSSALNPTSFVRVSFSFHLQETTANGIVKQMINARFCVNLCTMVRVCHSVSICRKRLEAAS